MLTDNYAIATMILMALGLGAYHLYFIRSKDFVYNRGLLIGVGLVSLLLPLIKIPIFREEIVRNPKPDIEALPIFQPPDLINHGLDLYDWYWIVVCCLLILFSLRLLLSIIAVKKLKLQNDHIPYTGPAFSFFSTIIVPDPNDAIVYHHESYHAQQGHSWDRIFGELLHCFLWFNPLVFVWKRDLLLNHEYGADRYVLDTTGIQPIEYLIHMQRVGNTYFVKRKPSVALVNSYYSFIINRTTMINQNAFLKTNPIVFPLLLLLCVVLVSFKSYTVIPESSDITVVGDTIPEPMITVIDTVSYFDTQTSVETVKVIKSTVNLQTYLNSINFSGKKITVSDTIAMFDTDTQKETIQVVNYSYPVELLGIQDMIDLDSWNLAIKIANEILDKKQ